MVDQELLIYHILLLVKEDSLHHKQTGTSAGMTVTLVTVEKVVVVLMALLTSKDLQLVTLVLRKKKVIPMLLVLFGSQWTEWLLQSMLSTFN